MRVGQNPSFLDNNDTRRRKIKKGIVSIAQLNGLLTHMWN